VNIAKLPELSAGGDTRSFYSHGEYRHCAPASISLLTISGRGEGTGSAAGSGGGEGTDSAASTGRGESTGSAASTGRGVGTGTSASEGRECTATVPNVQQWLVPTQTRCALGNLARASLTVMHAGEPLASDGLIMEATARIRIMRAVIAKASPRAPTLLLPDVPTLTS
jgi:hypothetical protein